MRDESTVRMWVSAYMVFGAPWKSQETHFLDLKGSPFVRDSLEEAPTIPSDQKKRKENTVAFTVPLPIPSQKSTIYLRKVLKTPPPTVLKQNTSRTFTTFIKIRTKPNSGITRSEMEKDFSCNLSLAFKELWILDRSIQIVPWDETSTLKPITRARNFPNTKKQIITLGRQNLVISGSISISQNENYSQ